MSDHQSISASPERQRGEAHVDHCRRASNKRTLCAPRFLLAPRPWPLAPLSIAALLLLSPDLLAQPRRVWIPPEPSTSEKVVTALVHVAAYFWIFVLGSVIGSFLNVVAYRLPKGMPLFWPPSSCPSCGNRIAIRDNIPVLGWLLLKGKCRNCSQPISPRYPIVEAVVGVFFALLAAVELFTGGANLPFREPGVLSGVVSILLFPTPLLIAQFLFHAVWLSSMVAIVLIDLDRQPVPAKKFLAWMGTIAIIAVALEPRLLPVKAVSPGWTNERIEAVVQSLLGATLGFALGYPRKQLASGAVAAVLSLTGACFGWQAVVAAFVLGILIAIVGVIGWRIGTTTKAFSPPPLSFWVAIGAFIHLLIWRPWTSVEQLPGPATPWWAWLLYALLLLKP